MAVAQTAMALVEALNDYEVAIESGDQRQILALNEVCSKQRHQASPRIAGQMTGPGQAAKR